MTPTPSPRRKPGSSKRSGFTLIEVLVALAIVTVGMSAVLSAMTSSADTTVYLRDKTFAQCVALNRIAEVRLQAQLPAKGKTQGDVELAGRKWTWEQEVKPLPQVKGLRSIEVSVRPAGLPESQKNSWYATASGVSGDAVKYAGGGSPTEWNESSARQTTKAPP